MADVIRHRELAIALVTWSSGSRCTCFERSWGKTLGSTITMMVYLGGTHLSRRPVLLMRRAQMLTTGVVDHSRHHWLSEPRVINVCAYFAPAFVYGGPRGASSAFAAAQRTRDRRARDHHRRANGDSELSDAVVAQGEYEGIPVRYCARAVAALIFHARRLAPPSPRRCATPTCSTSMACGTRRSGARRRPPARNATLRATRRAHARPAALAHDK